MMARLDRLSHHVADIFQHVATALLVVMLVLNGANIFCRAIVGTEIPAVLPWTMVMFVWMVFIGFFPLCRFGNDVAIAFLTKKFGAGFQGVIDALTNIATFFLAGFLILQMPQVLHLQVGPLPMIGMERYWLSVPLFVSSAFLMLDALLQFSGRLLGFFGKDRMS